SSRIAFITVSANAFAFLTLIFWAVFRLPRCNSWAASLSTRSALRIPLSSSDLLLNRAFATSPSCWVRLSPLAAGPVSSRAISPAPFGPGLGPHVLSWSGRIRAAAFWHHALGERCIQRDRQRRFAAYQIAPHQLMSLAPPLGRELQPGRRNRQHVRLAIDGELPLERGIQPGCHAPWLVFRSDIKAISGLPLICARFEALPRPV